MFSLSCDLILLLSQLQVFVDFDKQLSAYLRVFNFWLLDGRRHCGSSKERQKENEVSKVIASCSLSNVMVTAEILVCW